jgi:probable rRNA maturation factor
MIKGFSMKDNTEQTIEFFEADIEYQLDRLDDIRLCLTHIVIEEKCGIEKIQYIFCTDEYLLGINKQHLGHDYYTDIITFPLNNSKTAIKSDIYISVDRVIENAKSYDVSTVQEFYRVIAHGLLHLCGYSDATDNEKRIMRERENYYLDKVL